MITRLIIFIALGWLVGRWLRSYLAQQKPENRSRNQAIGADLVKCPKCGAYVAKDAGHVCTGSGPAAAVIAFILVLGMCFPAQAGSGGRYLVEVTGSNVTASIEINGIKAEQWSLSGGQTAGASLNQWLRKGSNTLLFKAVAGRGAASLQAKVYFVGTTATGAPKVVSLLEIQNFDQASRGRSVSFNLASAPSLALWQAGTAPGAITTAEAVKLVGGLRGEMISAMAVGGGFDDVNSLKIEHQDLIRAFGGAATSQPLAVAPQNQQTKLEVSTAPTVSDLAVDSVGNSGLLRIARKDGKPLVAIRSSDEVAAVPAVIVGWLDGAWHILRRAN